MIYGLEGSQLYVESATAPSDGTSRRAAQSPYSTPQLIRSAPRRRRSDVHVSAIGPARREAYLYAVRHTPPAVRSGGAEHPVETPNLFVEKAMPVTPIIAVSGAANITATHICHYTASPDVWCPLRRFPIERLATFSAKPPASLGPQVTLENGRGPRH